jgi:N-acetylmuramoyl-L-alanine amidase
MEIKMKICLDAGHSLVTAGKRTPNGIKEWTLNNAVCNFIAEYLKPYGVEVIRTDDTTGNTDITLANRVKKCNEVAPSVFISIHHNAFRGVFENHTGVLVLVHSKGTKEDWTLANTLAPLMAQKTGIKLSKPPVRPMILGVLNCKATAVLCEGGFMDSLIDNPIICSEKGQRAYAEAVTEGIVKYLRLTKIPVYVPTKPVNKPINKPINKPVSKYWYARYITKSRMNVRKTPSIFGKVLEVYPAGTVFDIHEQVKGWGHSPSGWVYLPYCKKI